MKLAGATSIAFVVPTGDEHVAAVQERWRSRGMPDLELKPYGRGDHLFTVFRTPLDGSNAVPPGLDLIRSEAASADARIRNGAMSWQVSVLADCKTGHVRLGIRSVEVFAL